MSEQPPANNQNLLPKPNEELSALSDELFKGESGQFDPSVAAQKTSEYASRAKEAGAVAYYGVRAVVAEIRMRRANRREKESARREQFYKRLGEVVVKDSSQVGGIKITFPEQAPRITANKKAKSFDERMLYKQQVRALAEYRKTHPKAKGLMERHVQNKVMRRAQRAATKQAYAWRTENNFGRRKDDKNLTKAGARGRKAGITVGRAIGRHSGYEASLAKAHVEANRHRLGDKMHDKTEKPAKRSARRAHRASNAVIRRNLAGARRAVAEKRTLTHQKRAVKNYEKFDQARAKRRARKAAA